MLGRRTQPSKQGVQFTPFCVGQPVFGSAPTEFALFVPEFCLSRGPVLGVIESWSIYHFPYSTSAILDAASRYFSDDPPFQFIDTPQSEPKMSDRYGYSSFSNLLLILSSTVSLLYRVPSLFVSIFVSGWLLCSALLVVILEHVTGNVKGKRE